jgi:hypothetical protein
MHSFIHFAVINLSQQYYSYCIEGGLVMLELVLLRGEELRPIIFDGVLIDDDD